MAKPVPPEEKQRILTNIIQNACIDFQVPDKQIERFTQEVPRAVGVFELAPPEDHAELRRLHLAYEVMKERVKGPMDVEHIPSYADVTANHYVAMIAGLENPEKYARGIPPEQIIRGLLLHDKEDVLLDPEEDEYN